MLEAITGLSRISLIIIFSVFTIADIVLLIPGLHKIIKGFLSMFQSLSNILFLAYGTVVIYFNTKNNMVLFLFLGQLLFVFFGLYFLQTVIEPFSIVLLRNVFMLLSVGFIILERLDFARAVRQFIYACIALVISIIVLQLIQMVGFVKKIYYVYGVLGALLLASVYFLGTVEYGAKLSLSFKFFSVQPSEFVKLIFIFFVASVCTKFKNFVGMMIATLGAIVHVLILALSKDFGSALIFIAIYMSMLFIAYRNYIVLIIQVAVGVCGSIFVYNHYSHIQTRFMAWSDPLQYVDDAGYQISQSLFAIGGGSWFGTGLYNGMPNKIPVVSKDFIFAAICEEFGCIIGLEIFIIFACIFLYIIKASVRSKDDFYRLVSFGFSISITVQAFLNLGGVTNFIPSTGVTLPLVSYGGSSLLATFIGFALVEAVDDLTDKQKA